MHNICDSVILQRNCKFGVSEQNPSWLMMLTSISGINYALDEYENFCEYGPNALPTQIIHAVAIFQIGWIYLINSLSRVNELIWP